MRARLAVCVGVLALSGCSSPAVDSAASASTAQPSAATSSSPSSASVVACQAVRKASDTYLPQVNPNGSVSSSMLQSWSTTITEAANPVTDPVLKPLLLNLADIVRRWAAKPPSKVQIATYKHDVEMACQPYGS